MKWKSRSSPTRNDQLKPGTQPRHRQKALALQDQAPVWRTVEFSLAERCGFLLFLSIKTSKSRLCLVFDGDNDRYSPANNMDMLYLQKGSTPSEI